MWYFRTSFDAFMQLFRNHTHLKKLHVYDQTQFLGDLSQHNQLLALLPNMAELTMATSGYFGIEPISRFIGTKKQCEKIQLDIKCADSIPETDFTALKQELQDEWTIEMVEGIRRGTRIVVSLFFERKDRP